MILLKIKSLPLGTEREYKIEKLEDFAHLYRFFPQVKAMVESSKTINSAAQKVADYLGRHNMDATVIDPTDSQGLQEEIIDPNEFDDERTHSAPKSLDDLRDILESDDDVENVDIPDKVVQHAATHRWDT